MLPPLAEQGTSRSVLGQWLEEPRSASQKKPDRLVDGHDQVHPWFLDSLSDINSTAVQKAHQERSVRKFRTHIIHTYISRVCVRVRWLHIRFWWPYISMTSKGQKVASTRSTVVNESVDSLVQTSRSWIQDQLMFAGGCCLERFKHNACLLDTKGQTICSNTVVVYADAQDIPVSPQSHVESPTPRGTTSNRCRDYPIFEPLRYQIGKWPAGRIALLPSDVYNIRKYIGNI